MFNNRRLLEPIGNIPPSEYEEMYYRSQEASVMVAGVRERRLRRNRGGSPDFSDKGYDRTPSVTLLKTENTAKSATPQTPLILTHIHPPHMRAGDRGNPWIASSHPNRTGPDATFLEQPGHLWLRCLSADLNFRREISFGSPGWI